MNEYIPDAILDVSGLTQLGVTGVVENTVNNMLPEKILEVRSDDPGVRKSLEKWCDLTGKNLLTVLKHDENCTAFVIRNSANDQ